MTIYRGMLNGEEIFEVNNIGHISSTIESMLEDGAIEMSDIEDISIHKELDISIEVEVRYNVELNGSDVV